MEQEVCQVGKVIGNVNKQQELEASYKYSEFELVKATKRYRTWLFVRIFNDYNLKNLVKWQEFHARIFRELREETRKNNPERFIQSG